MLIGEVFEEFISVVKENNRYTIGLVNEKQIISLCSNKEEIGKSVNVNSPDKYNIFYDVNVNNQNFGYLWVSGEDENLHMISKLFYESLTVRLMYEINQATLNRKVTKDDELVKCLLNKDDFDLHHILSLFAELEIDSNQDRVAIYVVHKDGFNIKDVMRLKMKPDSKNIIYSLLNSKSLLIFKDIPKKNRNIESFKPYIREYIKSLKDWEMQDCFYFVGSLQRKLRLYENSYEHCFWLKNNIHHEKDIPIFFTDYTFDFFVSSITNEKVRSIFDYYLENGKGIDLQELIQISDTLLANDFNLTQTAEDMFLHKNTLIYKIKKYEEVFQIDIRGGFQGKVLFALLSQAFREYQKGLQAGEEL